MTVKCPHCGHRNAFPTSSICRECGKDMGSDPIRQVTREGLFLVTPSGVVVRCPKCSWDNGLEATHCISCGTSLEDGPQRISEGMPNMAQQGQPISPYASANYERKMSLERSAYRAGVPVSSLGGALLALALVIILASWAGYDSLLQEAETGIHDYHDYNESMKNAVRLLYVGIILAILGGMIVAFSKVRK